MMDNLGLIFILFLQPYLAISLHHHPYFEGDEWKLKMDSFDRTKMKESCRAAFEAVENPAIFFPGFCTDSGENAKLLAHWHCLSKVVDTTCQPFSVDCALGSQTDNKYPIFRCNAYYNSPPCSEKSFGVDPMSWELIENEFIEECVDQSDIPISVQPIWDQGFFARDEYKQLELDLYSKNVRNDHCKSLLDDNAQITFTGAYSQRNRSSAEVAKLFCLHHCQKQCPLDQAQLSTVGCSSVLHQNLNVTESKDMKITCHCISDDEGKCPTTACTKTWADVELFYQEECAVMTEAKCGYFGKKYNDAVAVYHNGACYAVDNEKKSLSSALLNCKNHPFHPGKLATIQEKTIGELLKEKLGNNAQPLWTGLRQIGKSWFWVDDEGSYLANKAECNSIFWGSEQTCLTQTADEKKDDSCAMFNIQENIFETETVDCKEERQSLCQFGPDTKLDIVPYHLSTNQPSLVNYYTYSPVTSVPKVSEQQCKENCTHIKLCRTVNYITTTVGAEPRTMCRLFARYVADMQPLQQIGGTGKSLLFEKKWPATTKPLELTSWDEAVLKVHNDIRSLVAKGDQQQPKIPGASYMAEMVWSKKLQDDAADQAKKCAPATAVNEGENFLIDAEAEDNENIGAKIKEIWFTAQLGGIGDDFAFDSYKADPATRFLTQLIWPSSHEVGCGAFTNCKSDADPALNVTTVVCRYSPKGNVLGEPLVIEGKLCSNCSAQCSDDVGLCSGPQVKVYWLD